MEKLNSSEREYSTDDLKADALYGYDLLMEEVTVAERSGDYQRAWRAEQEAHTLQAIYELDFGEKMPERGVDVAQGTLF